MSSFEFQFRSIGFLEIELLAKNCHGGDPIHDSYAMTHKLEIWSKANTTGDELFESVERAFRLNKFLVLILKEFCDLT